MPKPVDIGIFMIGKTQVDREEVQRWLDFIGVQEFVLPEEETVTDPALLIALAAKRCYKSFEPGLNPNVTKVRSDYGEYFDNILKSGHGSVLEHSVYNLAIENVSRVFTGEMNRHRAGWAISEGSMRFIRYSESIPYWVPDSIKGDEPMSDTRDQLDLLVDDMLDGQYDLNSFQQSLDEGILPQTASPADEIKRAISRRVFRRAFSHQESAYRALEMVWADELKPDSKFKGKKEITSMMRRIVGMGVATGGVWSGNIRGLRHVLTMRASAAAEEEILHVFSRVAKRIQETEPHLFGDFTQTPEGFWVPKYVKV